MKATKHLELFNADMDLAGPRIAINNLLGRFSEETVELIDRRNARTGGAIAAIFREQATKWRAIHRREPRISPDLYTVFMRDILPENYHKYL